MLRLSLQEAKYQICVCGSVLSVLFGYLFLESFLALSLKYAMLWRMKNKEGALFYEQEKRNVTVLYCPVHYSYRHGRHGGRHTDVWGGTFDQW